MAGGFGRNLGGLARLSNGAHGAVELKRPLWQSTGNAFACWLKGVKIQSTDRSLPETGRKMDGGS
jgi:hypothetical protein